MEGVGRKAIEYRARFASPPLGQAIAALARRQHGVVALGQLTALGLSPQGVRRRTGIGQLHPVHSGVYAVGHSLLSREGRFMAAVLACGPGAVLSHRSAASLWELRPTSRSRVEVTTPGQTGRSRPRIQIHRSRRLGADDVTVTLGIPITTVARTLLDLAEVADRRGLERAVERAESLRIFDLAALRDVLDRAEGRRGAPALRKVLAHYDAAGELTRSELELRFLELCRAAAIPPPRVNALIELNDSEPEVDFAWPEQRLIVETDGHETHGTRAAFERDRRRDQRLIRAGWRVVRFTWRQIVHEPHETTTTLRALLPSSPAVADDRKR